MRQPIEWDQLFMDMAHMIAQRSKDDSTQVGAILVNQHNVLMSEGFNGPPRQLDDTLIPWNKRPHKYAYIYHAEANAIDYALEYGGGRKLEGCKIYCTHSTCVDCMLKCIRWGVREIVTPVDAPPYKLSDWQVVTPLELIAAMNFPKLNLRKMSYERNVSGK